MDPRTRLLLEAPIARTLLKLGAPNVLVMFSQAAVGLIETYFVGKLGTDALAGMALGVSAGDVHADDVQRRDGWRHCISHRAGAGRRTAR